MVTPRVIPSQAEKRREREKMRKVQNKFHHAWKDDLKVQNKDRVTGKTTIRGV